MHKIIELQEALIRTLEDLRDYDTRLLWVGRGNRSRTGALPLESGCTVPAGNGYGYAQEEEDAIAILGQEALRDGLPNEVLCAAKSMGNCFSGDAAGCMYISTCRVCTVVAILHEDVVPLGPEDESRGAHMLSFVLVPAFRCSRCGGVECTYLFTVKDTSNRSSTTCTSCAKYRTGHLPGTVESDTMQLACRPDVCVSTAPHTVRLVRHGTTVSQVGICVV